MEVRNNVKDKFGYSAIADTMLEAFPEIGEQYAKEIRWISDTFREQGSRGQTLYFDRCFSDFLGRLLIEEHPDKVQIEKAFDFLENMASSHDVEVRNLLQVTVLEYLRSWHVLQRNSEKLMLPETKKLFDQVKRYLSEPPQNEIPYFVALESEDTE